MKNTLRLLKTGVLAATLAGGSASAENSSSMVGENVNGNGDYVTVSQLESAVANVKRVIGRDIKTLGSGFKPFTEGFAGATLKEQVEGYKRHVGTAVDLATTHVAQYDALASRVSALEGEPALVSPASGTTEVSDLSARVGALSGRVDALRGLVSRRQTEMSSAQNYLLNNPQIAKWDAKLQAGKDNVAAYQQSVDVTCTRAANEYKTAVAADVNHPWKNITEALVANSESDNPHFDRATAANSVYNEHVAKVNAADGAENADEVDAAHDERVAAIFSEATKAYGACSRNNTKLTGSKEALAATEADLKDRIDTIFAGGTESARVADEYVLGPFTQDFRDARSSNDAFEAQLKEGMQASEEKYHASIKKCTEERKAAIIYEGSPTRDQEQQLRKVDRECISLADRQKEQRDAAFRIQARLLKDARDENEGEIRKVGRLAVENLKDNTDAVIELALAAWYRPNIDNGALVPSVKFGIELYKTFTLLAGFGTTTGEHTYNRPGEVTSGKIVSQDGDFVDVFETEKQTVRDMTYHGRLLFELRGALFDSDASPYVSFGLFADLAQDKVTKHSASKLTELYQGAVINEGDWVRSLTEDHKILLNPGVSAGIGVEFKDVLGSVDVGLGANVMYSQDHEDILNKPTEGGVSYGVEFHLGL
jgi:hypothetical protein